MNRILATLVLVLSLGPITTGAQTMPAPTDITPIPSPTASPSPPYLADPIYLKCVTKQQADPNSTTFDPQDPF